MSLQQIAQVDVALAKARVKPVCPVCGAKPVRTSPDLLAVPVGEHAATVGTDVKPMVVMCAARVCGRCGHVALQSLVALNLDSML